ncbi:MULTISPECIES: hypothetical protein [unclassified Burkholderia]|uniref:hypothetical protein n=1 Tax=unclassified Burkholderia TaxID=2613784 RepID=UPI001E4E5D2B|nr:MULTISPECIES: hypothetical protein [unclassified Burkholderia]UEP28995.1 hypothetical protein LMA01_06140 [Burkholderia sp. B21-007]UEP42459.1 hypothetical protein LMA02_05745 [Burkholderia sp. B21-005]
MNGFVHAMLGIMASRIRKHRQTRLKGYRLTFRRDILGPPDTLNAGPDTRCTGVAGAVLKPFPRVTLDTSA